jgi:CDP-6-deoxy-D-xylo-4-hexulose-3-dehydrase
MTTIEGGIISTDDPELYDLFRVLRSHGMVRESLNLETKKKYLTEYPDLNPDFIFAFPSHNMRTTELNGLLGLEQLPRLDENNKKRTANLEKFLSVLNPKVFKTDFKSKGSSNYALTLVLREPDFRLRDAIEKLLTESGIEFRRGLAGGGNQLRQPYLRKRVGFPAPESLPETDHVHHFGWYIGNYPDLDHSKIEWLGKLLGSI